MEQNTNYTDVTPQTSRYAKTFRGQQLTLLSRSIFNAGIGFILIAIIGGLIGWSLYQQVNLDSVNSLWIISMILIFAAMILSMVVNVKLFTRAGNVSKGLIWAMWLTYIIAEGIGFGILFLAFMLQFKQGLGILYLNLIFAAGGLAFVVTAFIGKRLSARAVVSLGKFIFYASMAFMAIFFVSMIAMLICTLTSGFAGEGLYFMLIGVSTVLFLLYMVFDVAVISKMQQFLNYEDSRLVWTLSMIFGFKLLVDLVGLVWNIAILFLRFSR